MLKRNRLLILIFILALTLRTVGINHGFPFIFHPDEPALVRSALGIRFDLNPNHFDWPSLHFYLNYFVYNVFLIFRRLISFEQIKIVFPILWREPLVFYLISRLLNAFLGAATIFPIYLTGKRLFSEPTGIISTVIFSVIPFHVFVSHYALIDVPMVFWLSWSMYFISGIFASSDIKNYIFSGFFAGLAMSTKYNGGLIVFMLVFSHILRVVKSKEENLLQFSGLKGLALAALLTVFGFTLGTPYSVLDFETFSGTDGPSGAFWQFINVGHVELGKQIANFFTVLYSKLFDDFGITFFILYIITSIYSLTVRRKLSLILLVVSSIIFIFYISGFEKNRSHYYLISYPSVALVAGYGFMLIFNKIRGRYFVTLLTLLFFSIPIFFVTRDLVFFVRKDTRVVLYDWLTAMVKPGDLIMYDSRGLNIVLEKFSDIEKKREIKVAEMGKSNSYVILSLDEKELNDFFSGEVKLSYIDDKLSRINWIKPNLRNGPNILVYSSR